MNNISIADEVGFKPFDYLYPILEYTLKLEKCPDATFSIILTDEDTIKHLNREYRKIDKVTDVLSFAFEDNEDILYNESRLLGDIYICIPRMKSQAKEYGHSEKRELSFLAVHGLLHLLGYDHIDEESEKIMFELQEMILNENHIER